MFWRRRDVDLLAQYSAIISDLRDEIADRNKRIAVLEERLLALVPTQQLPAPAPQVSRRPPSPAREGVSTALRARLHWPGMDPDLRPPSPATPPGQAPPSPVNDIEAAAVIASAKEGMSGG